MSINVNSLSATVRPALHVLAILILGLSGCTTMAPYDKPVMQVPVNFKESKLWSAARVQADQVPDEWWLLFKDPTLDQLQVELAQGNQNLKNSVAQYQAARAALGISQALLAPTLGGNASVGRGTSGANSNAVANTYSVGVSASWELDVWGRLSAGVQVSQAKLQASQDDLAAARLSLQATLVQTYFSLRALEAQSVSLERAVQAYQRLL